jgi:heavy metal translocating P-type ATPase
MRSMRRPDPGRLGRLLVGFAAAGLAAGGAAAYAGRPAAAALAWGAVSATLLVTVGAATLRRLGRGEVGVDVVAALALAGALVLGEHLAGAVIGLMVATGMALEEYAATRARAELAALVGRTPRVAHRYEGGGLAAVPIEEVRVGDRLLVKPGEVLPVDGIVTGDGAVLDESAMTGEARAVRRPGGDRARSGTVNAGPPFDLHAVATAEASTYAGVVRLVRNAQASKAPFARLADRYALLFVPLTLAVAGTAWALSGDAVRALAVLVVATPCPLILAVPVALVSGISRAARRGILVKDGGALETLARARTVILDKTGTITTGRAKLVDVLSADGTDAGEILRLAASLDQASQHVLAASLVQAARERGLALTLPAEVDEVAGAGLHGRIDGRRVAVGRLELAAPGDDVPAWAGRVLRRVRQGGESAVFVAVDGTLAGALLFDDRIRPDTPHALRTLRAAGIDRIVMLSGDRMDVAEIIASALDIDVVLAERSPEDKVDAVMAERALGPCLMVGDGINDAPALAAADVGVAMGARGAGASSESADVVLMVDRLDRLTEGVLIARRAKGIAVESVIAGMALSTAAMVAAAAGLLVPVAGAVVQEVIDVAVILNALRVLRTGRRLERAAALTPDVAQRLALEHRELEPVLDRLRATADRLDTLEADAARTALAEIDRLLRDHVVPHERTDESELYPTLARVLGGHDPMGTMSRTHREIHHLCRLYSRLVADLGPEGPSPEERRDLRRVLYGLDAILRLHYAQEEELYATITDEPSAGGTPSA